MDLSFKELKELLLATPDDSIYQGFLNKNIFIRTVTMAHTGKLIAVSDKEILLSDACWIADTGRFADFLKSGKLNECEPFPAGAVIVGRGAIVDICLWNHDLPREQK